MNRTEDTFTVSQNKRQRDLEKLAHGRSALRERPEYLEPPNEGVIPLRAQLQERIEEINRHLRTHGDNKEPEEERWQCEWKILALNALLHIRKSPVS